MQPRSDRRTAPRVLLGVLVLVAIVVGALVHALYGIERLGIYGTIVVPIVLYFLDAVLRKHLGDTGGTEGDDCDPPPPIDPAALVRAFLAGQHDEAQTVRLSGLLAPGCQLVDIYVPLDVVRVEPDQVHKPAFRRLCFARLDGDSVPVTQALAEGIERSPLGLRAVLVGEAGSGKSSVVGELMHRCRPGAEVSHDWPQALRGRHVLRFDLKLLGANPVSEAGAEASPADAPRTHAFWSAVRGELCRLQHQGELPCTLTRDHPDVQAAVASISQDLRSKGLLLLDGFDEVEDPARRQDVRTLVEALGRELGPHCALLVTARPYVYPAAALEGFVVWRLQPLTLGPGSQATDLVEKWHRVRGAGAGATRELLAALAHDPARAELATRPLLLTLLIVLGLDPGGATKTLPIDRTGLIEGATALFIERWFKRIQDRGDGLSEKLRRKLDQARLRKVLELVSLDAGPDPEGSAAPGGRAEVTVSVHTFRGRLLDVLPPDLHHQAKTAALVILDGAGLLFDRGSGSLGYVHRLFQEYLAACALVAPPPPLPDEAPPRPLVERLRLRLSADPAAWREVTRFTAVRLLRPPGGPATPATAEPAVRFVKRLLADAGRDAAGDRDYQVALAAGLALADLRLAVGAVRLESPEIENLRDAGHSLDAWFQRLVDDREPVPQTRRDFGRLMGRLGREPRCGIIPRAWTAEAGTFPLDLAQDFDWVPIPAGPFTPGSGADDDLAYPSELGGTAVEVPAFAIARYPVTCAQFAAFTRAGGYGEGPTPPPWWKAVSEEAVAWWHGGNPGLEQVLDDPDWSDENKRAWKDWLARRGPEARRRPWFEDDPQFADWLLPNHPVIGVSWFEAMAFCAWLTHLEAQQGGRWRFSLPSEVQWERVARGAEGRRWPWGNEWRDGACNSGLDLGSTSAVGVFPFPSPEGLCDLAGNVWEWTLTRWGPQLRTPVSRWSADLDDGRDDPGGADLRVMRGSSWYVDAENTPRWCRGAFRFRHGPDLWYSALGFRVVRVSLAVSVS